jgi:hypothetical protein
VRSTPSSAAAFAARCAPSLASLGSPAGGAVPDATSASVIARQTLTPITGSDGSTDAAYSRASTAAMEPS